MLGLAAWLLLMSGRAGWAVAGALIGAAMGPARVLEGAHHTADVVAGDLLGLGWLLALLLLESRGRRPGYATTQSAPGAAA